MPALHEVLPIFIVLVLLGVLTGLRLARWRLQMRGRRVARRGARGEDEGVSLLEASGFEVLEVQVRTYASVLIDGEETLFDLWIDAIAGRGGRRYVVEFKTGAAATMKHASTRLQLLEYALALPDHGLVLVDASSGCVQEIVFPRLRSRLDPPLAPGRVR